jgi:hypothetical protein
MLRRGGGRAFVDVSTRSERVRVRGGYFTDGFCLK